MRLWKVTATDSRSKREVQIILRGRTAEQVAKLAAQRGYVAKSVMRVGYPQFWLYFVIFLLIAVILVYYIALPLLFRFVGTLVA